MVIPKPAELKDFSKFEDVALLKLIAAHQPEAVAVLYNRYGQSVYGRAFEACGRREDAEKLTKEVFLYVWENASLAVRGNKSIPDWLFEVEYAFSAGEDEKPHLSERKSSDPGAAQPAGLPGTLKRRLMYEIKKRKAALLGAKPDAASR